MSRKLSIKTILVLTVALIVYWGITSIMMPGLCIFKNTTGMPCPGCGLTRSGVALLKGQWYLSLYYHALLVPIVLVIALSIFGCLNKIKSKYIWLMLIILLVYYIVRLILYFPDQEPLNYLEKNIINYLLKIVGLSK